MVIHNNVTPIKIHSVFFLCNCHVTITDTSNTLITVISIITVIPILCFLFQLWLTVENTKPSFSWHAQAGVIFSFFFCYFVYFIFCFCVLGRMTFQAKCRHNDCNELPLFGYKTATHCILHRLPHEPKVDRYNVVSPVMIILIYLGVLLLLRVVWYLFFFWTLLLEGTNCIICNKKRILYQY